MLCIVLKTLCTLSYFILWTTYDRLLFSFFTEETRPWEDSVITMGGGGKSQFELSQSDLCAKPDSCPESCF